MIKNFSLVAMAALVMVGCNSGSNTTTNTKSVSSYSDAEKLAYAIAKQDGVLESATQSKQNKNSKSREVIPCESGSMEVFFPLPIEQVSYDMEPNKMVFHNCKMDGEIANGDLQMQTSADGMTETFFTESGFSVTGGEEQGSILPGGTMSITQDGAWEVLTINLEMNINGVVHGGENLIYRSQLLSDGSSIEYPVSGKEKIGDSAYFTVDPVYDASATPFKTDANGDLRSGLFRYIDQNQHSVELKITGKNVVSVWVDENGNDSRDAEEVSSIKLD